MKTLLMTVLAALGGASAPAQLGRSELGRPIVVVRAGDPRGTRVLVVGCIHGYEPAGIAVGDALRRAHPHEDLWLVPVLNPDGLAHDTRGNANGADLNRDFFRAAQPETRVARAIVARVRPRYTIWFHQHMNLVWAFGRSSVAGRRYAQLAGMRYYHHRWLAGTATNWQNHLPDGERSITVELPAGRLDVAGLRRQVRAVLGLALAAP